MRDSMEPRKKKYVKVYLFLSCRQNFVNKCCPKFVNQVKRSETDVLKVISKRAIWKITEATGNFMGKNWRQNFKQAERFRIHKKVFRNSKRETKTKKGWNITTDIWKSGYEWDET